MRRTEEQIVDELRDTLDMREAADALIAPSRRPAELMEKTYFSEGV